VRLFIALEPPAAAVSDLDQACAPYRASHAGLRWTSTDAWHITLAFLGEVSDAHLARLLPRMERAARRHLAFPLSFNGAGAFPAPGRANVLWSGLAGDRRALGALAQTVAAGAGRAGVPPPDAGRRYRPHLTLARSRAPVDVSPLVDGLSGYCGPSWTPEAVHVIRSHLGAGAGGTPRYETLAAHPFKSPEPREQPLLVRDSRHSGAGKSQRSREGKLREPGRGIRRAAPAPGGFAGPGRAAG
jgi:2'-5' RNA ligase